MATLQERADRLQRDLDRLQSIQALRAQGKTIEEIGATVNLTKQRVSQILQAAERDREAAR